MPAPLLHQAQFHLRRWFSQRPRFVIALGLSLALLILTLLAAAQQWQSHADAQAELQSALASTKAPRQPSPALPQTHAALPSFDSAHLVEALHTIAGDTKLPVDEISYALEDSDNQPYLRYRVTLTATASYPTIRQFTDSLRQQAAYVSLDTISCSREDIAAAALSCDLGFSAFYRKPARG
jgi:hypothetical protein